MACESHRMKNLPKTGKKSGAIFISWLKGKWQQNFLSSHLKETLKQYVEVCYRIFISALFRKIFSFEILSCPPSWIFVREKISNNI